MIQGFTNTEISNDFLSREQLQGTKVIMAEKLSRTQKESIIQNERGILSRHGRGFHFCSDFAQKNLYYVSWSDEYVCDSTYSVDREFLNCYLLMNVMEGRMTLRTGEKTYIVNESQMILLDLRHPHFYKADTTIRVQQYMLDGNALPAYYRLLTEHNGNVFHKDSRLQFLLSSLHQETMAAFPNDHTISMLITSMLCSLTGSLHLVDQDPVRQAKYYMNDHYMESITLEDIAAAVSLSKYYFCRLFEKKTGIAPWEFLIRTRIRNAMQMLAHSQASVEDIAASCGYSSTAHFIRSFKEHAGVTPGFFRRHFTDVQMDVMFYQKL